MLGSKKLLDNLETIYIKKTDWVEGTSNKENISKQNNIQDQDSHDLYFYASLKICTIFLKINCVNLIV